MSPVTSVGGRVDRGVAVPAGMPLVRAWVKLQDKETKPPVAGASQETLVPSICHSFVFWKVKHLTTSSVYPSRGRVVKTIGVSAVYEMCQLADSIQSLKGRA
jgi:hypothetical protein